MASTKEAVSRRIINVNPKNNQKPWFTEEDKRRAYLTHQSNNPNEEHKQCVAVKNRVNAKIRKIKLEYWKGF